MKYFVKARISENLSETPEGFLVCIGVPIARTGTQVYGPGETPLDYKNGEVLIDRPEKEVFRPETLASFEGKPVTVTHPEEFVNPENWRQLAVGTMQNIRRGEDDFADSIIADLLITDRVAIELVKNGLREVSCGYTADYEQEEPGIGTQINIVGNHLALVQQGRAGSSYAINDHKGKVSNMTLKERFKNLSAKFTDAEKELSELAKDESLGGEQSAADPASGQPAMAKDEAKAYDGLMKAMDALASALKAKAGDADEEPPAAKKDAPADDADEDDAPSEDADEEVSLESRLKKLEAAVATLLKGQSQDSDEDEVDDDGEEIDDADEDDDEIGDEDKSSVVGDSHKTGDTASRAEILAPGIEVGKNVKVKALKAAYATKDGKAVIHMLSANKEPNWKDAGKVDSLFIAASEMLKLKRVNDNAKTKQVRDNGLEPHAGAVKSAEDINAINAKHYGLGH